MRNIWMLTEANLRKGKIQLISMFGLIFLAALFLNLGLLFLLNFSGFYMERVSAQNAPDAFLFIEKNAFEKSDEEFLTDYPGVKNIEIEECMILDLTEFNYNTSQMTTELRFFNVDAPKEMGGINFIGRHIKDERELIYLPYIMSTGGYQVGDLFTFKYQHKDYSFTVGGFVEELYYGSTIAGRLNVYLPNDDYERFTRAINDEDLAFTAMGVRLNHIANGHQIVSDYLRYIEDRSHAESTISVFGSALNELRAYRTMISSLISTILVAFSMIIVFVCLIVIRFRIVTNIQDGMTNIGALKAVGYTSNQIILSIILQFSSVAAVSSILGIFASYSATPVLSGTFAGLIGLNWQQGFDPMISCLSFLCIVLTVILVSIMAAKNIHLLHPIIALRGGNSNNNVKRNSFPLSSTRLNLHIALAMKGFAQSVKQNLMISIILIGVSFASLFSIIMYYNFVVDHSAFMGLSIDEPCNVEVFLDEHHDNLLERMKRMPEVRKAFFRNSSHMTTIQNEAVYPIIMEDYSRSESTMIMEGKFPDQSDEIAFPAVLAKKYGISVGSAVELKFRNKSASFIVSGTSQSLSHTGRMCNITLDGMRRLQKDYELTGIDVFLEKGENTQEFIDLLDDEFGDTIVNTVNMDEAMAASVGTFATIASLISVTILITTILMVILVVYLIIKTNISRKKREIGIQKAVGYSTFQLMNQITLGFIPIVFFGTGVGAFLGYVCINNVLTVLFSVFGIMRMDFYVGASWPILTIIVITAFSYCVSMLISWRIRNVSPYVLTSE